MDGVNQSALEGGEGDDRALGRQVEVGVHCAVKNAGTEAESCLIGFKSDILNTHFVEIWYSLHGYLLGVVVCKPIAKIRNFKGGEV